MAKKSSNSLEIVNYYGEIIIAVCSDDNSDASDTDSSTTEEFEDVKSDEELLQFSD